MACTDCGDPGPHSVVELECRERRGSRFMEHGVPPVVRELVWMQQALQCSCGRIWATDAMREENHRRHADARRVKL